MVKKTPSNPDTPFATNRKAYHDYEILEKIEAGIELKGTEIKSIRQRQVSLDNSFARIEDGQVVLYNMHVNPYEQGNRFNTDPVRERRILLHRNEIQRLQGLMARKQATLIPLKLYPKKGLAKLELAVCRGKRVFEKRERIRERESDRELQRRVRTKQRDGS